MILRLKYFLLPILALNVLFMRSQQDDRVQFQAELDSIRKVIGTSKSDTVVASSYVELSNRVFFSEPDSAFEYCRKALAIIEQSKERKESSNPIIKTTLSYIEASALNNTGYLYQVRGQVPNALEAYSKSLKLRESIGDKGGVANTLSNMGLIYLDQRDFSKAEENFKKSLNLCREINMDEGVGFSLAQLALVYQLQSKWDLAVDFFKQALALHEKTGNPVAVCATLKNIGAIYRRQEKFKEALELLFKALDIEQQIGDLQGKAFTYSQLGELFYKQGNYKRAKSMADSSLLLSQKIGNAMSTRDTYLLMSKIDSATGNFSGSLANYKKFVLFRDSIVNMQNTKKTVQTQMQYEFDKKAATDSIKNSEAKKLDEIKHQQEISKQKTFTYGGIAGFMVMIVVAGISYNAFRNKKKANTEIAKQKELVEEKQKEILDSIHYAHRIQRALITNEKYIQKNLKKLNKR